MRPDSTFLTMVSLYCFLHFTDSLLFNIIILENRSQVLCDLTHSATKGASYQRHNHDIISCTSLSSFESELPVLCYFLSHFVAIFCCCGQAISQIQIFFFSLSSSIKSDLLAIVVFRSLNSKSQTSFPHSFSSIAPCSHRSLYQITSLPISLYSLAQLTAIIISALLCRVKYSLFARTLHPAAICSTVSSLS